MTTFVEETAALERFLAGPAPYSSGNPVPPAGTRMPSYATAEQHLAEALGRPALARQIADNLSKPKALELADAIRDVVAHAVRMQADVLAAERLAGLVAVVEQGLDGIPPECEAIEGACSCKGFDPTSDEPWVPVVCGECGHCTTWHTTSGCAYVYEADRDKHREVSGG